MSLSVHRNNIDSAVLVSCREEHVAAASIGSASGTHSNGEFHDGRLSQLHRKEWSGEVRILLPLPRSSSVPLIRGGNYTPDLNRAIVASGAE